MLTAVIIAALTCVAFICNILIKPTVNTKGKSYGIYWIAPLLGALACIIAGVISPKQLLEGLTADSDINPLKILALFLNPAMSAKLASFAFFSLFAICFSSSKHQLTTSS